MSSIIVPGAPIEDDLAEVEPKEFVRPYGEINVDSIEPLLLIKAGVTGSNRIEFYHSYTSNDLMVKFLPFHDLEEKGWRRRLKQNPELSEPSPFRTIYTDHGLMIRIADLPSEELTELFFRELIEKNDVSLFPKIEDDVW